ncbi:monocarboxylate transporter 9-like isoform X3 [Tubulanus polymorphus]|uniref:monocarboxylate transporter 9-like isoform X3 n=1 Tax=Tubulanus polymorphus TaxID=672921 RepID=UPI003DA56A05
MASSIVDEAAKNGNSNLLETIIVISAGLISSFIVGGNYVDGILVAEWVDYFHQGSGVTAWLGTAIIGISSCGAPIATLLIKRFGFRKVFFFAATINASALALTSFVYNIYLAIALRVLAVEDLDICSVLLLQVGFTTQRETTRSRSISALVY